MRGHDIRQGQRRVNHRRGAAVLLVVYGVALTSLLLANISMQRATVEFRAAERFRTQQASFWLAEAALDDALRHLRRPSALTPVTPDTPPAIPVLAHQSVLEDIVYQVPGMMGDRDATFTVTSARTVILPPAAPGERPRQQLTRTIVAEGREGSCRTRLMLEVEDYGPVQGVWGRRAVIANGGGGWADSAAFFAGTMRSRLLSMTTTIAADNVLTMEGMAVGDPSASHEDNATMLRSQLSSELLSLRTGYKFINGITQDDNAGLDFVPEGGLAQTQLPHVTGAVSVSSAEETVIASQYLPPAIDPADCGGTLNVTTDGTMIDSGFTEGQVRDLSPDPDEIILCVQAVVPEDDYGWLMTLLNQPRPVVFRKPATVYVVGRQTFDLGGFYVTGADGVPKLIGVSALTGDTFQPVWDVAVAAKISAVNAQGNVLPGGVRIVTARLPSGLPMTPSGVPDLPDAALLSTPALRSGLVWMQPGQLNGASIYAPDSLVVIRARDSADKDDAALHFENLVGDEVIVDLKADTASFGWHDGGIPAPQAAVTQAVWNYDLSLVQPPENKAIAQPATP